MWSRSVRVADGTISLLPTFSALASPLYAGGGHAGNEHGVLGGTVDYDLGYDANGWDTQGFRSPAAGYLDNHETAQPGHDVRAAPRRENGRGGSHARTSSTQQVGPLNWAPD